MIILILARIGLPIGGGVIIAGDMAAVGPFTASYAFDALVVVIAFAVSAIFWRLPPEYEFFNPNRRR